MEVSYTVCPKCGVLQLDSEVPEGAVVSCPQCKGNTFTVSQLFKILGEFAAARKAGKQVLEPVAEMLVKAMKALQAVLTTPKEE